MKLPVFASAVGGLLISTALPAKEIFRCEVDGHVTYSQTACDAHGRPAAFTPLSSSGSGLRPGEKQALQALRGRDAQRRDARAAANEQYQRQHISHSDRLRLRELEMEKSALSRSLSRGSMEQRERRSLQTRIIGIDRQIEQIRAARP